MSSKLRIIPLTSENVEFWKAISGFWFKSGRYITPFNFSTYAGLRIWACMHCGILRCLDETFS